MLSARPRGTATLSASPPVKLHDEFDLLAIKDRAQAFGGLSFGHPRAVAGSSLNDDTDGVDVPTLGINRNTLQESKSLILTNDSSILTKILLDRHGLPHQQRQ
jgi:hypothetical protein